MKVGDLVRPKPSPGGWHEDIHCVGVVTRIIEGLRAGSQRFAIVFWNNQFPNEEEYIHQLEVICE